MQVYSERQPEPIPIAFTETTMLFQANRQQKHRARLNLESLEARETPANSVVYDTSTFPARATVHIKAVWDLNRNGREDAGEAFSGTGAMVSKFQVLTCAHVLFDIDPSTRQSGYASWVIVTPGKTPTGAPFGQASGYRWYVPQSWANGNANSDVGIIALNSNIGNRTGWYNYGWLGDSYYANGLNVNMRHYPGNEPGFNSGGYQWYSYGRVSSYTSATFSYRETEIRSLPGSSGAPVYVNNLRVGSSTWNQTIVGINVRSTTGTSGSATSIRITESWFNFIRNVLSMDRAPAEMVQTSTGVVRGTGRTMADANTSPFMPVGPGLGLNRGETTANGLWLPGPRQVEVASTALLVPEHTLQPARTAALPDLSPLPKQVDLSTYSVAIERQPRLDTPDEFFASVAL